MNDDELKLKLSDEEYQVLRKGGTEAPYSGEYLNTKDKGMYKCKVCGNQLFSSDTKLDSSKSPTGLQGWPSFDDALPGAIKFEHDTSYGMNRTEVSCAKCGSHLGHVFDTDESHTQKHYCINSVCLDLEKDDSQKK